MVADFVRRLNSAENSLCPFNTQREDAAVSTNFVKLNYRPSTLNVSRLIGQAICLTAVSEQVSFLSRAVSGTAAD